MRQVVDMQLEAPTAADRTLLILVHFTSQLLELPATSITLFDDLIKLPAISFTLFDGRINLRKDVRESGAPAPDFAGRSTDEIVDDFDLRFHSSKASFELAILGGCGLKFLD
ncbi:hypothetical protein HDV00_005852 [Rhizophlyctis rosea]|nr:hypothetical protein HDV00_005852 [Rhizophlyctis rosea]